MNQHNHLSDVCMSAFSESLSVLRESINASFASLITPQLTQIASDVLSESLKQFSNSLAKLVRENIDFNILKDAIHQFVQYLPSSDLSFLTEDVTINSDYVILTNDAIDTLSDLLNKANEAPTVNVSSKMTLSEYVGILIAIICMIVPMLQNSYYRKLDAIEAQQYQMQEAEYQETILDLEAQHTKELEELNNNINELLQYLESVQETDLPDANIPAQTSDAPEMPREDLAVENVGSDESDNQNMHQSSN